MAASNISFFRSDLCASLIGRAIAIPQTTFFSLEPFAKLGNEPKDKKKTSYT
jgi:hypothetical protein